MEHVEYAGVHSGDSACVYPAQGLSAEINAQIKSATKKLALALEVKGLMNIQFAVKDEELFILEVNPRASRSVPFISKANGIAWAELAALIMAGAKIKDFREIINKRNQNQISVKEAVFSFNKFDGSSVFLGPEMKSTGEVMGISDNFAHAFAKAQIGAGLNLPKSGKVFLSFRNDDKEHAIEIAKQLIAQNYSIVATSGTASVLEEQNITIEKTNKVKEGRPNITDMLKNNEISLIFNVPSGKQAYEDSTVITKIAQEKNIPVITTVTGALATVQALQTLKSESFKVKSIQDYKKEFEEALARV